MPPTDSNVVATDDELDVAAGAELANAAMALARRFAAGATLWCLSPDWPSHGRHVAVEFVHPVIVGKRALPAVSVTGPDPIAALRAGIRTGDAVVVIGPDRSPILLSAIQRAPAWGVTSIWIGAGPRPSSSRADHVLWVPDDPEATGHHDGRLVLRYHVLWELTHVCLEHPGLVHPAPEDQGASDQGACATCSDEGRLAEVAVVLDGRLATVCSDRGVETIDTSVVDDLTVGDLVLVHAGTAIDASGARMPDAADFLYPFLNREGDDPASLLADLAKSAEAKALVSTELRESTLAASREVIAAAADEMATRFAAGGRLFTFGNGGSSTDASDVGDLFACPPWGSALPARCFVDDTAVLTALGNDVGFDLVFARQVIAHGTRGDIALGISTSGSSRNLLLAFEEAHRRGLLTVGLAGYSGGDMARSPDVDHCLVVRADSVHRIQETQAALYFALWLAIGQRRSDASLQAEPTGA